MFKPKVDGNQVDKCLPGSLHALYRVHWKTDSRNVLNSQSFSIARAENKSRCRTKQVDVLDRCKDFQTGCFKWDTNNVTGLCDELHSIWS